MTEPAKPALTEGKVHDGKNSTSKRLLVSDFFYHVILWMWRSHRKWKVFIFFSCTLNKVHVSLLFSRLLFTKNDKRKPLCECSTFGYPKLLQSNQLKCLRTYQCEFLFLCLCVLRNIWNKVSKCFTFLKFLQLILIGGKIYVCWLITKVFLRLLVRPKSEHADEKWLSSVCRSCRVSYERSIIS